MRIKVVKVDLPKISSLVKETYEYSDSFKSEFIDEEKEIDILTVTRAFFSFSPGWIGKLFVLRNKIVTLFGLKTGGDLQQKEEVLQNFKGEIGDKVGIFKVYNKTENEMILGENDAHLNFRVSLLIIQKEGTKKELIISTIVHFNNWFGKLYFLPVKPFHKLIVPAMLKSTLKNLEK
ncbi:DUF2867 domain-containing protein [Aquimarina litoralis]|uniref:DUF2867 domain-containing protein n=1 Tax=Aquimarina litoralis TaxID=584605 RepID=UPI001C576104|nr:DUF2867 domain-containing protein [Aquimarina litoralis]MBW1297882.1 DUF2867 domain-containing protein [Aquimarina litoralis]